MTVPCLVHQLWQVNEVVSAVHALEQVDCVIDIGGADVGLNDKSISADVG